MGLFTGSFSASRRPASSAPLKRRSLGRSREILPSTAASLQDSLSKTDAQSGSDTAVDEITSPARSVHFESQSGSGEADQILSDQKRSLQDRPSSLVPSEPATSKEDPIAHDDDDDEELEPDFADLQSDNAFLYQRQVPLDSALGLEQSHPASPSLLDRIEAYVADHHLDCFGITHYNELVRHHNQLVPFLTKAPRFLSIHSLKRKELERDHTEVLETIDTCPRQELCLGRCQLGFSCPTQDLISAQSDA